MNASNFKTIVQYRNHRMLRKIYSSKQLSRLKEKNRYLPSFFIIKEKEKLYFK